MGGAGTLQDVGDFWRAALERSFKAGEAAIARRCEQRIQVCVADAIEDHSRGRQLKFRQELLIANSFPFQKGVRGFVLCTLRWIDFQKLCESLGGARPDQPMDIQTSHIRALQELLGELLGSLPVLLDKPSAAVEMSLPIFHEVSVDSTRRKLGVSPFQFSLELGGHVVTGLIFVGSMPSQVKRLVAQARRAA